ncbi:MAG: hypothetical protein R3B54_09795 [Bdellovibrionota bacterium]
MIKWLALFSVTELNPAVVQRRNFIRSLYERMLGRAPSNAEIVNWDATGQAHPAIAQGFALSDEHLRRFIDLNYRQFLKRGAEAAGQESWRVFIRNSGNNPFEFQAQVLGSAEYWDAPARISLASSKPYVDVLKRPADPVGLVGWTAHAAIHGRVSTARGFLASEEYRKLVIREDLYQGILNRVPAASEVNAWYAQFAAGNVNGLTIIGSFYGSDEYYNSFRVQ